MLDIGWTELLVIGVVALIVVGPKDLPGMFRTLGRFTGKMRRMARDFQRAMEDAADDTGMKETASNLKTMTSSKNLGLDTLKDAADRFDKWQPPKPAKPAGTDTEKMREERATRQKEILDRAKDAREAREASANNARASSATPEPAAAPEPPRYKQRERPGTPTAASARPKNMPRKKTRGGRG